MKIFIMAGGSNSEKLTLPHSKDTTYIETLIDACIQAGVELGDIIVGVNSSPKWEQFWVLSDLERFGLTRININHKHSTNRSFYTFRMLLNSGSIYDEDLIVIEGDSLFDRNVIELLKNAPTETLLASKAIKIDQRGLYLSRDLNFDVKAVTDNCHDINLPRYIFSGGMKLSSNATRRLKGDDCSDDKSLLEMLINKGIKLKVINIEDKSKSALVGGSLASLMKRNVVRKEATGAAGEKLRNEVNWLKSVPPQEIRCNFPQILSEEKVGDRFAFEMPYYAYESLRSAYLSGHIDIVKFRSIICETLDTFITHIYSQSVAADPKAHFQKSSVERFRQRINYQTLDRDFNELRSLKSVNINDTLYNTWYSEYDYFIEFITKNMDRYAPERLTHIHGDLHLQNILVSLENSQLIYADPRGEMQGGDIFYDLGKIWHSVNGLYDLIHTDQYLVNMEVLSTQTGKVDFTFTNNNAVKKLQQAKQVVFEELEARFSSFDDLWYEKMRINEVMHFATLTPFHSDPSASTGCCDRALVLYCQSLKLWADFKNDFDIKR